MADVMMQQVRAAGEVPPPPARAMAFQVAMSSVHARAQRGRRFVAALVASLTFAVPAGVMQVASQQADPPAGTGAGAHAGAMLSSAE